MQSVIPPEIITKCLSQLGKNDLLNCRLVNQDWNEMCLKNLRKEGFEHEQELTQDNIQRYIDYSRVKYSDLDLPFHLNFSFDHSSDDTNYRLMSNCIQQLQQIFGNNCVRRLTLRDYIGLAQPMIGLFQMFILIAHSLTNLNISELSVSGYWYGWGEILQTQQFDFPNLRKFKSRQSYDPIQSFVIERSQNLKELRVCNSAALILSSAQIAMLNSLTILYDVRSPSDLMETIRACGTPLVLKKLDFAYFPHSQCAVNEPHLHEILRLFSASLTSLTVTLLEYEGICTIPFLRLNHLRFLRFRTGNHFGTHRICLNQDDMNMKPEAFPVLASVDISTRVYFRTSEANSLQSVKCLTIRVTNCPFDAKEYVDQLQELFPNVIQFIVINECEGQEQYLNQFLIALIQSDAAPLILELELRNCEKNYLGQILSQLDRQPRVVIENMGVDQGFLKSILNAFQQFSAIGHLNIEKHKELSDGVENNIITFQEKDRRSLDHKMTGVKRIRLTNKNNKLKRETCAHCSSTTAPESFQEDLFLADFPKFFPLLRIIEISEIMVRGNHESWKNQSLEVLTAFPELMINILQ